MSGLLVAVVCAYWPERHDNVERICWDLHGGSRPPDRIILLDNQPQTSNWTSRTLPPTAVVLSAGWNTWTRGKYVAALLDPADWYLLVDDDVSPDPHAVRNLLHWGERLRNPEFITGFWGAQLSAEGSFGNGAIIQPHHLTEPLPVDAFHGRFVLATFGAIVNMLRLEQQVRVGTRWDHEGCDILAGLANPGSAWAVPANPDTGQCFAELPIGGVALQWTPGYFELRDEFTADVLAARQQVQR